jgi:hypothetical protein
MEPSLGCLELISYFLQLRMHNHVQTSLNLSVRPCLARSSCALNHLSDVGRELVYPARTEAARQSC